MASQGSPLTDWPLDALAALAEQWKLLIVLPILVAAGGYFYFSSAPREYQSSAVLRLDQNELVMLGSATVVDRAVQALHLDQELNVSPASARVAIMDRLKTGQVGESDYQRVTFTWSSDTQAQAILTALVAELLVQSRPRGRDKEGIELQIQRKRAAGEQLKIQLENLQGVVQQMREPDPERVPNVTLGDIGQATVALVQAIEAQDEDTYEATLALEGTVTDSNIIQPPTPLPGPIALKATSSAIALAFAVELILIIAILLRDAIMRAARNQTTADKIDRIVAPFRRKQRK